MLDSIRGQIRFTGTGRVTICQQLRSDFGVKFCCSLDFRSCVQRSGSKPVRFGVRWKALRSPRAANNSRSDFGAKIFCSFDSVLAPKGRSRDRSNFSPVRSGKYAFCPPVLISLPPHIRDRCDETRAAFLNRAHSGGKKLEAV